MVAAMHFRLRYGIFTIRTRHSDRCRHGFAARPTVVSGLPRDT